MHTEDTAHQGEWPWETPTLGLGHPASRTVSESCLLSKLPVCDGSVRAAGLTHRGQGSCLSPWRPPVLLATGPSVVAEDSVP